MSRCTKLRDWRSLVLEGVSSLSTIFNCTKRGDYCTLIGDCVRTCVVFHLNAEATQLAMGGIYFFEERSRNVNMIAGLLFKYNPRGLSLPIKCSKRGLFSRIRLVDLWDSTKPQGVILLPITEKFLNPLRRQTAANPLQFRITRAIVGSYGMIVSFNRSDKL